MSNSNQK